MGTAAAAIIAAKRRHIIRAFRDARATSMHSAKPLADLGLNDSHLLRGLVDNGAIKSASPGTFYLDEPVYQEMVRRRRAFALVLMAVMAILGFVMAYIAVKSRP